MILLGRLTGPKPILVQRVGRDYLLNFWAWCSFLVPCSGSPVFLVVGWWEFLVVLAGQVDNI